MSRGGLNQKESTSAAGGVYRVSITLSLSLTWNVKAGLGAVMLGAGDYAGTRKTAAVGRGPHAYRALVPC